MLMKTLVCLSLLKPDNYTEAQRMDMAKSLLYSGPVDPANWIGLRKFSPLLEYLRVRDACVSARHFWEKCAIIK